MHVMTTPAQDAPSALFVASDCHAHSNRAGVFKGLTELGVRIASRGACLQNDAPIDEMRGESHYAAKVRVGKRVSHHTRVLQEVTRAHSIDSCLRLRIRKNSATLPRRYIMRISPAQCRSSGDRIMFV
jgi:hypothetical protein